MGCRDETDPGKRKRKKEREREKEKKPGRHSHLNTLNNRPPFSCNDPYTRALFIAAYWSQLQEGRQATTPAGEVSRSGRRRRLGRPKTPRVPTSQEGKLLKIDAISLIEDPWVTPLSQLFHRDESSHAGWSKPNPNEVLNHLR